MWLESEILQHLDEFIEIYKRRPIKNNKGGMQFSHMFYFYYVLKKIKPDLVIESGVYKGQSTWLIEITLPKTELLSLDINLGQRQYFSKKAKYSSIDFKFQNIQNITDNSLVLFDDHVNHLERLLEADVYGFKHIIFEDNYSGLHGDFQTIKQIQNNIIFNHKPGLFSLIKTNLNFLKVTLKKIFNPRYNTKRDLDLITKRIRDGMDEYMWLKIKNKINYYYEFPPLQKNKNLYNQTSDKENLLTDNRDLNKVKLFDDSFNFFTYVNLK